MNRQLQIELWPECRCSRCAFCNLVLSSNLRGDGSTCNPNKILSPFEKLYYINKASDFLDTVDWSKYDELFIRGGEVFNDYDKSLESIFSIFIEKIAVLIKNETIKKLFLITSLKYKYTNSLLKFTLELLERFNIDVTSKIMIGTSWDNRYRFNPTSSEYWNNNINILDNKSIPIHITSILTQSFIDGYYNKDKDILNLMNRNFDFIPAQGKPELLYLDGFFPKRNDCIKFLSELQNHPSYISIFYRLLHQDYRRAETIYFTEYDDLQIRDLKNYTNVLNLDSSEVAKCNHPKEYSNYVDSDACFLCDINTLKKVV